MNVGDKDDDLQKEVHTASKICKNVHGLYSQNITYISENSKFKQREKIFFYQHKL